MRLLVIQIVYVLRDIAVKLQPGFLFIHWQFPPAGKGDVKRLHVYFSRASAARSQSQPSVDKEDLARDCLIPV